MSARTPVMAALLGSALLLALPRSAPAQFTPDIPTDIAIQSSDETSGDANVTTSDPGPNPGLYKAPSPAVLTRVAFSSVPIVRWFIPTLRVVHVRAIRGVHFIAR